MKMDQYNENIKIIEVIQSNCRGEGCIPPFSTGSAALIWSWLWLWQ